MIYSLHATKHKVFLSMLALVVFTTVLVAQNHSSKKVTTKVAPSNVVAPAEFGKVQVENKADFATTGEEYLIYTKGNTTMQYDPATGKSIRIAWNPEQRESLIYKGNLREFFKSEKSNH